MKEAAIYFLLDFADYKSFNSDDKDVIFVKKSLIGTIEETITFLKDTHVTDPEGNPIPFSVSMGIINNNEEGILPYFEIDALAQKQVSSLEFKEMFYESLINKLPGNGIILSHDLASFYYPDLYKTIGNPLEGEEMLGKASVVFKPVN